MSSATSTQASTSSSLDPWIIPTQNFTRNNVAFFAGGSTVLGVIVLLIALRRSAKNDLEELKPKPAIHDIWALLPEDNGGLENSPLQWKELHPLSSSQVLSQPAPPKSTEIHNPFNNYFASVMELFSVERMDKALLGSIPKEDPPPEYTKSELMATVFIAMPQPTGYDSTESLSLPPELEFGVYNGPTSDAV
ncbi:hypothetical protein FRC00_013211 [Tulasnella sp. 408]|nr:hypothetical protein FRC00_013211 [Tulasnella sp. 408]